MNIMFSVAVVSLTLQVGMTAALLILGQAPRWRRVRWFGAVACTAACYSAVDMVAALRAPGSPDVSWSLRLNLFIATLHGASWMLFTYAGREGGWSSVPAWVRRVITVAVLVAGAGSLSGLVAAPQRELLEVPSLGISYERPVLSPLGNALGVVPFLLLLISMIGVWQDHRRGVQGTTPVLVGFVLFLVAAIEELLVAAGVVQFIFLGDLGYVCVVVPVTLQIFSRFRDDANQLDQITDQLAEEVQRRTDERDRAREQVVEEQRLAALGRLAAGVGHEINNPLQYLRFSLEELRELAQRANDADALDMIDRSFEGVDRIRQVVEDLRTYVRPRAVEMVPVDVREVVRAALRVSRPQARQGLTVITELHDVPLVLGHEGRLVQVVLNPLVNAMQSMSPSANSPSAPLVVRTRTTARGWAQVEIIDSGPGFSPDVIARLGEPYVTTRSEQGGTGLGLFVSRGIVEAHGGTMHCENNTGGGAVVRIELPNAAAASVAFRTPPTGHAMVPTSAASALRVLLVEDDVDAMRALLRGLQAEQINATGFTKGQEAIAWLEHNAVDLVVTDLMMPGMSGWEFAEALERRHPRLRASLVVLTGGASTPEAEAFAASGTVMVLDKPVGRKQLSAALRQRVAPQSTA
ncbi:MAG: response regulator [Gemmatimonas sp.]|jgi:signal transduction histidine kinase/CheY-like chemotaxis protein|uniref:hybrid sensor histidine kinase/response regulator n=1 Tax=Gemmatimonas sp. TaxID=1962908 RepID=UPI0031C6F795|nr:response regulator [Gemmatimonas sp.]